MIQSEIRRTEETRDKLERTRSMGHVEYTQQEVDMGGHLEVGTPPVIFNRQVCPRHRFFPS